jgi:hypothetical protein
MASTVVDVVEKLIQLALKNPNREEAASAALKAVALIEKHQIPIGADVSIPTAGGNWVPPSKDFMDAVEEMLNTKRQQDAHTRKDPATYQTKAGTSYDQDLMIQDRETSTKEDAARQRFIDGWRALREERKRLEGEVQRFELAYSVRFWGVKCPQCGREINKPWV